MQPGLWRIIKTEIAIWRVGILPGIAVIGLVMIARIIGSMQTLEWLAFDSFLRLRPEETIDKRIVLVGLNEDDLRSHQDYAMSDRELAKLLSKLQAYKPSVIGLDIYRDLPINPGHEELVTSFKNIKNLIAIEKVLPEKISPPRDLLPEQIGFADQITDIDGKLRRSLLGTPTSAGYKLSFAVRLATVYLAKKNISLENGLRDRSTMRFGQTEIPRFLPNSGGYIRADAGGVQTLLNYRSGRERFRILSGQDIKNGKLDPAWIRDRIVIIGVTAPSRKDFITTSAIKSINPAPGRVYGIEIQAHAVSQIISAVLDNRPLIHTWDEGWEYVWIFAWGFLGIAIARLTHSPLLNLVVVGIAASGLFFISYLLLIWGWWVPVIPAILVLTLNGMELMALYQYNYALRLGMQTRQAVIESTFETIHNGPLQSLAKVLKLLRGENNFTPELLPKIEKELEKLNYELRGIYEFLQREYPSQDTSLYLGNNVVINLQDPLHEILYQVYSYTLDRDFPCFKTIKVKIRTFEPIDERCLSIEHKRGICRFLEEALCNVGKHATGVTNLKVTCFASEGWYTLSIIDNGLGVTSYKEGRGTQQFINLAQQLQGKFKRSPLSPHGTICELSWPISKSWLR
ncbi:CHASE2 domain-containing protein [Nostoc sp. TCL26-01]|uniref:sensor histidine kinase n=1 Tax=Nostoc sp. TCL26-01 TaxID=2576904 RepID=UPI0015BFA17F|nr:CHASE2 domain-containing protein [Nostoc sp. TCL26-01]QLE56006.1 CHASE2 domain-containing protein [Nostoc sp. TCL26-01]